MPSEYPWNEHVNGEVDESLDAKLERFEKSDSDRSRLVRDLTEQVKLLDTSRREAYNDLENERRSRRDWQNLAQMRDQELMSMRQDSDTDPFILVLIDGDGMLFKDDMYRNATGGGADAAFNLVNEIKRQTYQQSENALALNNIMVHIFANVEGLARTLTSIGTIETPSQLHAFARGFTMSQPLFSFTDVGPGKEHADYKLKEMLKLFLHDHRCKRIIFGGCHDNGYLHVLEQYRRDEKIASRISLLEATPAEKGFRTLGFPFIQAPSVFRDEPLLEAHRMANGNLLAQHMQKHVITPSNNGVTTTTGPPGLTHPLNALPQTPAARVASPANGGYANVSKAALSTTDQRTINIAPSKPVPEARKYMLLNAAHERIDKPLPKPDPQAQYKLEQRIRDKKVCNDHYLLGGCYKYACAFDHDAALSQKELDALRAKARARACQSLEMCDDVNCIYGHICPNPKCSLTDCFFKKRHSDRIDSVPRYRQYEDETLEQV